MSRSDHTTFERLTEYIDQHLQDPDLSIDTLCLVFHMSRSNLFRLIKDHTELSPIRFIRQRRMERVRDLLREQDLRIIDIADLVGIQNPQNLSTYFNQAFGVSPSEFRKEIYPQLGESTDHPLDEEISSSPAEAASAVDLPAKGRFRHRWLVIAGLIIVGVSSLLWFWLRHPAVQSSALARLSSENSIAVLPFQNLSSPEINYVTEGIVDQIHSSLTLIEPLRVISRTSTRAYAKANKPAAQIARELGVGYLLVGQVTQLGNRIKLSVELLRAAENRTVWSDTYQGEADDFVGFSRTIAKRTASELNQTLSADTQERINKPITQNPEAFTEYLKGQYLMRPRTKEGLEQSLVRFDRALTLDSTFADAYAGKALAYFLLATENHSDATTTLQLAEKYALLTVRLDPKNALTYAILARLYERQNKWELANKTFQIALQNGSNDPLINYWYSLMLRSIGQTNEAIRYSTRAISFDPLFPVILAGHIGNLSYAGRFAEAGKAIREGQSLLAREYIWYWAIGFNHLNQEEPALALKAFEEGLRLNPGALDFTIMVAYLQARLGQPGPARALLNSLPDQPGAYANQAILYAGLGDRNRCLSYLEKGADVNSLPSYLKLSPMFRFLHSDPRFQKVLQRVGLYSTPLLSGKK